MKRLASIALSAALALGAGVAAQAGAGADAEGTGAPWPASTRTGPGADASGELRRPLKKEGRPPLPPSSIPPPPPLLRCVGEVPIGSKAAESSEATDRAAGRGERDVAADGDK